MTNSKSLREKVEKLLFEVNKPYRYIGGENGCTNKKWEEAEATINIVFPDLYEIGISNLGHKLLYSLVNDYDKANYLADRAYAPNVDFKELLQKNNLPLYGVETFKPLQEFDVLAFSLQYEISYPTILSILELSNVPIFNKDRDDSHPILIAGGPGSFNPEPMAEFIDVFLVGDGEEALIELMNVVSSAKKQNLSRIETLEELAKIEGVYIPIFYSLDENNCPKPISDKYPSVINKRISKIERKEYPVKTPIPFSSSVHDRAIIEIRRGCARMCRFCQSCFVNLPVREKSPEKILDLTEEILCNTGYDEYSLLSLSSSDYKDVKSLVSSLSNKYSDTKTSLSLPSQRADIFDLELAEIINKVRKSTITLAPEAGSQRLRDAINKNLSEEQIFKAILDTYQAGWQKVKLYFMVGLPTETQEDLDAMIQLLSDIKARANKLKRELNLKHTLEITCTVSIFVPKPFTPFQWFGQDKLADVNQKLHYLKSKAKEIKGVRLNYHDSFLCQLEAAFSRGDRELNKVIYQAWRNGSYLDAWNEHFNKELWYKSAEETGIDFEEYSSANYALDRNLAWDIINVGVDKNWLITEYKNALNDLTTVPCDTKCASCGVCKSFKTKPDLKSKPISIEKKVEEAELNPIRNEDNIFRYRLKVRKTGALKYISHLDFLSLVIKSARRAKLKLAYTQGFNPSPKISIGIALPLFVESKCEYIDIELIENMPETTLMETLNNNLHSDSQIVGIKRVKLFGNSIENDVKWAVYTAISAEDEIDTTGLQNISEEFLAKSEVLIEKTTKKGAKKLVDIRNCVKSINVNENGSLSFVLKAGQALDKVQNDVNLRVDNFLEILTPNKKWYVTRESMVDNDFKELV